MQIVQYEEERAATPRGDRPYECRDGIKQTQTLLLRRHSWKRDGTHVRLVHRGLMTAAMREQHRDGWQVYLARLSVAASGGEPGRDPNANAEETHGR